MGKRTPAEIWGPGSWQDRAHQAFEAGLCPRCRRQLEPDDGAWLGYRRCLRCRAWWGGQHKDPYSFEPLPGSLIIDWAFAPGDEGPNPRPRRTSTR